MKIQVEILEKKSNDFGEYWQVDKTKTIEFPTGSRDKKITDVKTKLGQLKSTLTTNQKIRVLEYHNDDSDETRSACKILF